MPPAKKKGESQPPRPPIVIQAFQNFQPVHTLIHYYVDLNTFFVNRSLPGGWWSLNRRKRADSLYELEVQYGKLKERNRYMDHSFQQAARSGEALCGNHLGFQDFFIPIKKGKEILGYLESGSFAPRELTLEGVTHCWRTLTGRKDLLPFHEFQQFVRVLLDVPVLDGPLLAGYQEMLETFARTLSSEAELEGSESKLRHLLIDLFSTRLPHSYFLNWALGLPSRESIPAWGKHIEEWPWIHQEIGLSRVPTTVIAVTPQQTTWKASDWLMETLKVYRLQRKAFHFARTLPETYGGKLEDYGLVFVTSPPANLARSQKNQWVKDLAKKIQTFAQTEMRGPVQVGVGQMVAPGKLLHESYRQALLAIHLGDFETNRVIFYSSEPRGGSANTATESVTQRLMELTDAISRDPQKNIDSFRDRYVESVLRQRTQDPHLIQIHFRYALAHLWEVCARNLRAHSEDRRDFQKAGEAELEKAVTAQDALLVFREQLAQLILYISKPRLVEGGIGIDKAKKYLEEHFHLRIPVGQVAGMAGLHPIVFGKKIREMTGLSFPGYIRSLRIKKAKTLLETGAMPIARVAQEVGFKSVSTFIQIFRKETGSTPSKYREEQRAKTTYRS